MERRERGPSRYLKVGGDPHRGPFPLPRCEYVWCGSSLVPHWFHALVPLVPRISLHTQPLVVRLGGMACEFGLVLLRESWTQE